MASADRIGYQGGPQYAPPIDEKNPMTYYPPPPDRDAAAKRRQSSATLSMRKGSGIELPQVPVTPGNLPPTPLEAPPPPYAAQGPNPSSQPASPFDVKPNISYNQAPPTPQQSPAAVSPAKYEPGSYFNVQTPPVPTAPQAAFNSQLSTPALVEPHSDRPVLPEPHYSEPYIAPYHPSQQQGVPSAIPQYSHPQPAPQLQPLSSLSVPAIPPRPISAPPGQYDSWQSQVPAQPAVAVPAVEEYTDDRTTNGAKRFFGNMLVVRGVRAGVQSVASTAKLPLYLSPWGDNNPFTLPNVRKRDVALAGLAHFGIDALAPSAVDLVDHAVQHLVTFTAEQATDQGIHKMQGIKANKVTCQAGVVSLELRIRHKLLGEDAQIRLWSEREAADKTCAAKGWFCPYLYASGRTPQLLRAKDFGMAELIGPGLAADASLAPTLLNSFKETSTPITALCAHESPSLTFPRFSRLAVFLVGISPYRTAAGWSQARIPNEARLRFHLLTHIPAIVLPASSLTPVCAWHPRTMGQVIRSQVSSDIDNHAEEWMSYLDGVVDVSLIAPELATTWKSTVNDSLRQMLQGAKDSALLPGLTSIVDVERAGIIMMRY